MAETVAGIRRANSYAIVRSIHAQGSASRRQIARTTGLSFATVATICTDLLRSGVLIESAIQKASVGRPTGWVSLNPDHGIIIGVDIAETYIHVATFGASLEERSSVHYPQDTQDKHFRDVADLVKTIVWSEISRYEGATVLGIGISAPGVVDPEGATSVFAANWAWRSVPLLAALDDGFPAPIWLDNPLKLLAISELWREARRLEQTFAVVNLGTGVGAGIAIEGQLFRGPTNSAGEWGHCVAVVGGRPCRCGSRGCVEAYVGAPGIIQTLRDVAPDSPILRARSDGSVTNAPTKSGREGVGDQTGIIQALAGAIDDGDPVAIAVMEQTGTYLGAGLASLINLLNPDAVLLAGWVSAQLGPALLEHARAEIEQATLEVPRARVEVGLARGTTADHANPVALGAAALALERYLAAHREPRDGSSSMPSSPQRQPETSSGSPISEHMGTLPHSTIPREEAIGLVGSQPRPQHGNTVNKKGKQ